MTGTDDWHARLVADWLFLLLRFAMTRDDSDRARVQIMAEQIDAIGRPRPVASRGFFRRTSEEVCMAVVESENPQSLGILKRHADRIDDLPLRRCFRLAAGLDPDPQLPLPGRRALHPELWRGLCNQTARSSR